MADLSTLTKDKLVKLCKERGLKGYSRLTKPEMLSLLSKPCLTDATSAPLRMIDLFAGTGAFTQAFTETGKVKCVFANDFERSSKDIYDANHAEKLTLRDIHDVSPDDIPPHDILTAGFPCQPFSIAGKRLGLEDARSNVFFCILKIVDRHKPKVLLLENVKGLLTHDNGKTFSVIRELIESRGYKVQHSVIDTAEVTGIPQHRERLYILCTLEGLDIPFPVLEKMEKRVVTEFLETGTVPGKYYYSSSTPISKAIQSAVQKKGVVYQYRRVYVRENKSGECPTLTANMGSGGHNVPIILDEIGVRKLTPRECFSLQGFPEEYKLVKTLSDSKLYKLAGNAVSLPVVRMIAKSVVNELGKEAS